MDKAVEASRKRAEVAFNKKYNEKDDKGRPVTYSLIELTMDECYFVEVVAVLRCFAGTPQGSTARMLLFKLERQGASPHRPGTQAGRGVGEGTTQEVEFCRRLLAIQPARGNVALSVAVPIAVLTPILDELTAAQKEIEQVKQALEYAMSDGLYQEVLAERDKLREALQTFADDVHDRIGGGGPTFTEVKELEEAVMEARSAAQEGSEK